MNLKTIKNMEKDRVIKDLLIKSDILDELLLGYDQIRHHKDFFWDLKKDILEACKIINGEPMF